MTSSISSSMASNWASKLFTQLDTKNQGYIEQSDLASAFSKIADSSTDVEEVFSQMDSDSDGKVTKDEITTALQQVADELDSQFNSMRMQGGGQGGPGGMPPPPPPPGNDAGFTKEELASQLEEIGDTDSKRSELISSVIENFEEADSDSDGKVNFQEAMAYDQSNQSSSSTTTSSTDSSSSSSSAATAENDVMMKIMQLMHAYQVFGQDNDETNTFSALSITA
jgi:Ca2+-binding EF-hand superfamily protein